MNMTQQELTRLTEGLASMKPDESWEKQALRQWERDVRLVADFLDGSLSKFSRRGFLNRCKYQYGLGRGKDDL